MFKRRQFIGNKITTKKFFSGPKPPNMLTWAERIQIKNLHEKDPEEWDIETLADSFPATKETILKILNTQWKPDNIEKMKQKDKIVYENWQLLADNKLDVDAELLNHLKKFLPRREEFLASIDNNEMIQLFEKPEPKKIWNNGQMSKILESYDNSLKIMDEKQNINKKLIENKNHRQILEERINYEASKIGETESFRLDHTGKPSKHVTFTDLKKSLESNKQENLMEKVIVKDQPEDNRVPINERLARLAGYTLQRDIDNRVIKRKTNNPTKTPETNSQNNVVEELPEKETNNRISAIKNKQKQIENYDKYAEYNYHMADTNEELRTIREEPSKFKKANESQNSWEEDFTDKESIRSIKDVNKEKNETFNYAIGNKETNLDLSPYANLKNSTESNNFNLEEEYKNYKELEMDNVVKDDGEKLASIMEEIEKQNIDEKMANNVSQIDDLEVKTYDFPSERDREDFEVEEKSISQTFFWNDKNEEFVPERNVANLDEVKAKNKTIAYSVDYAEKIKIPKDKKGSGLTFRVKDCYYDDDGLFLYRVPGMTKTVSDEK